VLCSLVVLLAPLGPQDRPTARAGWVDPQTLAVDGDPSEWRGERAPAVVIDRLEQLVPLGRAPEDTWSGPADASLRMWLGWSSEDLVLGGEVRDERADYDPLRWFQGDSLELFLNVRDRDAAWGADDFQVMLAPDWPERPWGVYPRGPLIAGLPRASDGGFGGVEVASRPFPGGYRFEARIPWRNFAGHLPRAGQVLPFNFALCDRDGLGFQESYATWTGESDIAGYADRRGDLELEGGPAELAGAAPAEATRGLGLRSLLLVLLAATYGVALATRRVWRSPRMRRAGLKGAAAVVSLALVLAAAAQWSRRSERAERTGDLERYWGSFERLLRSGALGHPEPDELARRVQALLSEKAIAPVPSARLESLAPAGAVLLGERRTARRGLPYAPFSVQGAASGASAAPAGGEDARAANLGVSIAPGEALVLELRGPQTIDAVQLVTLVTDPRYLRSGTAQVPVLAVEVLAGGALLPATREVRHRQDLHHQEDEHADHPGLEPAFYNPGGRVGRVHGDGLLLELDQGFEADQVRIRHVGGSAGYRVDVLAVSVRIPGTPGEPPAGLRATPAGEWAWSACNPSIEAEVAPLGRAARWSDPDLLARPLRLSDETLALVRLRDRRPVQAARQWAFLPVAALTSLACLAPFLVALLAEWLATRRRIRGKLGAGFAISSAVPLLALTLLLDASLREEHRRYEGERALSALDLAQQDLEAEQRELEREARRLLRIAELSKRVEGRFPETPEELNAWWGDGEGALRSLERTAPDGRRVRVGSGAAWRQIPRGATLRSGLARPWGQLLVCGVAQTASGAQQPLSVLVARPPRFADSTGAPPVSSAAGAAPAAGPAAAVRLIGAGRDPAPVEADLLPAGPREIRRALYGAQTGEMVGVLVATLRERGQPLIGDFTLTELLLAAALTVVFTALLFSGILTGRIVGPIERLDRAVRQGGAIAVEPEVEDEIGHLGAAIRSYSAEVAHRVRQLETLQVAQEEISSRLDAGEARDAVLQFFVEHAQPASAWLLWRGEAGEEPRLYGPGGRDLPLPEPPGLLHRALVSGQVLQLRDRRGLPSLGEGERLLLGAVERVVCLPLSAAGHCRGAVVLGLASADSPADLTFLRAACAQAAIVLENARLYRQAVSDTATGFLSEPGFRQRLGEEIRRAEGQPGAGVLLVQIRLGGLPEDDARATARLREAARRMRLAVRSMAIFGRSGSSDLKVAIPWSAGRPSFEALERRIAERVGAGPWPDGEPVGELSSAHAAWPQDGPSARFVISVLEERLGEARSAAPAASLAGLGEHLPAGFVAGSPNMVELLETVKRIAEQEATVLISGETGVGKDRLAELVHRWSRRSAGPLVHIHCPSLAGSLVEDELFGHEKGAFTGAHSRRMGPFEYASGGTIVLDEIGGLSPEGQVALLRLLETREVLPLGATRPVAIDVRVVATTSRDLALDVERGRFRGDLYFRLNVAQIAIPPRRLRRQALPELVESFVRRFNASAARPVTGVDPGVLDRLFDHPWPGNVRELENVLARGLILAAGTELRPEHVDLDPEASAQPSPAEGSPMTPRQEQLLEALAEGERISSGDHAARAGISARTALRDLLELAEQGYLVREGHRKATRFRRTSKAWEASFGQLLHGRVEIWRK
jgi:DNA-binding NtrC family response regulator